MHKLIKQFNDFEKKSERNMYEDLIKRLRKRAEIRRTIASRASVQRGEADRLSDLLEEAAKELEYLYNVLQALNK